MADDRNFLEDYYNIQSRLERARKVRARSRLRMKNLSQKLSGLNCKEIGEELEESFGEKYGRFNGAIEGLPADLSSQHEHYRLGTEKR